MRENHEAFNLAIGWQPREAFIDDSITNASLNGTTTLRPGGLTEVSILVNVTAHSGGGNTQTVILEGSNDGGTNFHTIWQTDASSALSATGAVVMNNTNGNVIDISRWQRIRVRLTSTGGTFTASVKVSGFNKPAEALLQTTSFTRSAATENGAAFGRQGGSRYASVQVVCTALVLGAATSISVDLQGSMDGTTWVNLASTVSVVTTNSQVMQQGGNELIDLGGFNRFRFVAADVGGAATSYTLAGYIGTDGSDWLINDGASASNVSFNSTFAIADLISVGAEAGNAIAVEYQLLKFDGTPLLGARQIAVVLSDTDLAGDFDLATNATIASATTGTLVAGTGTNAAVLTTTTAGLFGISVSDAMAETVYVVPGSGRVIPNSSPFVVARADQATAVFT